ncbi:MAG: response regulator [Halothece sp. Uz-M2-17]|nr:response regulator [Halothece sp. Uz-M2-17]
MPNRSEQRLTCNRIFRHLIFYHLQKFTGKIKVSSTKGEEWSFYFLLGNLTWASGGSYPLRRWRRQFYAATGKLPNLDHLDWNAECWDCTELRIQSESNSLAIEQVQTIVNGTLKEVLFDVVQAFEASIYQYLGCPQTLISLSQLTGIGDGMDLEVQEGVTPDRYYRLPYSLFPNIKRLQETTYQHWKKWIRLGLSQVSPNEAPLLLEPEQLQRRVSPKVYQNMAKGLQGKTSLRDLAFKFKKNSDFFTIASAIAPYYKEGLINFNKIKDLSVYNSEKQKYSTFTLSEKPQEESFLFAIDSSRKNQSLLSAIAQRQGYKFEAVSDGLNALYKIVNNPLGRPKIIFASYDMEIIKPTEFCTIIRRIELLQPVPIIFYTKHPIPNKEAQNILYAGANELINQNSLAPSYVNSIIKKYQQGKSNLKDKNQPTINQGTYSNFRLSPNQTSFSMSVS